MATNLNEVCEDLKSFLADEKTLAIGRAISAITPQIDKVAASWSRSNLGYHANVYYSGLDRPQPGHHFNSMQGLREAWPLEGTTGPWGEVDPAALRQLLLTNAGEPNFALDFAWMEGAERRFRAAKSTLKSMLSVALAKRADDFLKEQLEALNEATPIRPAEMIQMGSRHRGMTSSDVTAVSQGFMLAPHQRLALELAGLKTFITTAEKYVEIAEEVSAHLEAAAGLPTTNSERRYIFIGHGRSREWFVLKDFLEDELGFETREFNHISAAGVPTATRLEELVSGAMAALIVFTAEDEHSDGSVHARENVIHEAGLFQGAIGMKRAIVMLEDGCAEFSNIAGLGQIRFPAGNISGAFEMVRQFVKREHFVPTRQ